MTNIELIREVKRNAVNHWSGILPACGVDVPERGKHGACPVCGGTDRFHFIDDHHNGNWFCRQCDEPNHGDGLDLIAKVKGISIYEAAKEVSQALSLPLPEPARKEAPKSESRNMQSAVAETLKLMQESVCGESEYLKRKGLTHTVRLLSDGTIILPVLHGTELTGGQKITRNGGKFFVTGTRKKGSFTTLSELPETTDTVLIAEGYATALTVSQLHDGLTLSAFDADNLPLVALWVKEHYPNAKIIIAGDNDIKPDEPNKGKISAEKAAKTVNGWVTLPPTEDKADWDDYRQQFGIEKAKQAFNEGMYQLVEEEAMREDNAICIEAPKADPMKIRIESREDGVFLITPKADKETGEIINHEQWLSNAIKRITKGANDLNQEYLIIEWGNNNVQAIPTGDIGEREGWRTLKNAGLFVTTKSGLRQSFSDWLLRQPFKENWSITNKSGWHKGAYIMPDGSIIGTPEQPIFFNGQSAAATAYQTNGTVESWRNGVARLANGNSFMMIAIGAALAAPMTSIIGADSFGLHLYAQSTAGKTTAADMAVSLYGEPDLQRLTWYGTEYGMTNEAVAHNDGLLYLDEVGQGADPRHVYKSAYTLFNGKGKIQGAKEGGNRQVQNWKTVAVSTGEKDIETFLSMAGIKVNAGQLVRLLNIPMERATELHGCESGKAHADLIKVNCRDNYGTAGRYWIEYLADHKDNAKEAYRASQQRWNKLIPSSYGEQVHRASDRFATLEAALLMGSVITGWNEQDCRDAVQAIFNVWVAEFGTGNKEYEQIKAQAEAFLNAHGLSRFAPLPYDVRDMPIRDLAGYRKKGSDEGDPIIFYTFPSTFEKEIAIGFNYKQFAEVLKTAGMLTPPTSGRGYQRKSPRIDGRQFNVYVLQFAPETDDENDNI
ncbi:DUF927 domain-containing protein [Proteus vulgaris]|uniref:TOPRIM and DUF927 domain-containing protein n=1 Tax=Proteus vulgaris TaxID=585 RepID=UPI001C5BADDA|nr:TOPRIM and DUF927 domain-containing protein [Proteus vulgaris]MBW3470981.1 DUF927 domain-containing protein [Proteus vulgaris]